MLTRLPNINSGLVDVIIDLEWLETHFNLNTTFKSFGGI